MGFPRCDRADDGEFAGTQPDQAIERIDADNPNQIGHNLYKPLINSIPLVELCQGLVRGHRSEARLSGYKFIILVDDPDQTRECVVYLGQRFSLPGPNCQMMMLLYNGKNSLTE